MNNPDLHNLGSADIENQETPMFCFQCQETSRGSGCTRVGVCGKQPSTAALMDLLLFVVRGVATAASALRQHGAAADGRTIRYIDDALFATITNANFDEAALWRRIHEGLALRDQLKRDAATLCIGLPKADELDWCPEGCGKVGCNPKDMKNLPQYLDKARQVGVRRHGDEDVRSLKELTLYGLKGMAAYLEHARNLGCEDDAIDSFVERALSDITVRELTIEQLTDLVLETGRYGVKAMALLDRANTTAYGHPEQSSVSTAAGSRPGILVSGHDLHDLAQLLEQSAGSGIDIYTHGEMLPAHYYPLLKKHPHLRGNYGGSWWHQREEFASFNGPILMTSNCIVPPLANAPYRNRVFTTGSAGFPGFVHIAADADGRKDFSALIQLARQCQPPAPIDDAPIVGGFAHHQVQQLAEPLLEAVRSGAIRKFVVMAGCDGRMPSRNYYTEFAQGLPHDCVILTAGCAKYRYIKLGLGDIGGIPRVLDAGQCNDSYSLVRIAFMLRDALRLDDIGDLPIVYNIAWYEQKAVIVLLALLSLGVNGICLGPTLPAFLSPNVLSVLVERFGIGTITTAAEDLKKLIY